MIITKLGLVLISWRNELTCFHYRYHAVQEFNRGVFHYLIATDESGLEGLERDSNDEMSDQEEISTCACIHLRSVSE